MRFAQIELVVVDVPFYGIGEKLFPKEKTGDFMGQERVIAFLEMTKTLC